MTNKKTTPEWLDNIKPKIRESTQKSIDDRKERGFLIYKLGEKDKIHTSKIFVGNMEELNLPWDHVRETTDEEIKPIANFHTHFESPTPSYIDVANTTDLSLDYHDYILITNISSIKENKAPIWIYKIAYDKNHGQFHAIFSEIEELLRKYNRSDIQKLWYATSPEDREYLEGRESELRNLIDEEEIFENVSHIKLNLKNK